MNNVEFIEKLNELKITYTEKMLSDLNQYYNLLVEWNKKFNLTRIIEKEDVYLKHFLDSLFLQHYIDLSNISTLLDIGTGAGFPGIVLAIFNPNISIDLLESNNKKCKFLREVKTKLDLKNITIYEERAEDFVKNHREKYDVATCRAVSHLTVISELVIPALKTNGYFCPLKGILEEELKESKSKLKDLNSTIEEIIEYNLPIENSNRAILKIKKNKETNKKYPREYKQIIKDLKK